MTDDRTTRSTKPTAPELRRRKARAGGRAVAAVALACAAFALPLASATAAAATDVATGGTAANPVTWVDEQGRQYVVADVVADDGSGPTERLVVTRATPDGAADPSWGTFAGNAGMRPLAIVAPAAGLVREPVVAVSSTGLVTVTWRAADCATPAASCDRWVSHLLPDGSEEDHAHLSTTDGRPIRPLDDGSLVTQRADGSVGWMGPEGSDRGSLPMAAADLSSAALDLSGDLLVIDRAGQIVRWPAGGTGAITADAGCEPGSGAAIGPASDDGFVAACGGAKAVIVPFDADGTLLYRSEWTPAFEAQPQRPTAVAESADGHLWLASTGTTSPTGGENAVLLTSYGFEEQTWDYQRATSAAPGDGDGIASLRPYGPDHVAFVDEQPQDRVTAETRPAPPKPPQGCTDPQPFGWFEDFRYGFMVRFRGCDASGIVPSSYRPTDYRIRLTTPTTSWTTSGFRHEEGDDYLQGFASPHGELTVMQLEAVGAGGETAPPEWRQLAVPPFTVSGFIDAEQAALLPNGWELPVPPDDVARISDATITPKAYVAQLLKRPTGRATAEVEPVARLYRAYFGRNADQDGLQYWTAKRRGGQRLAVTSSSFAGSPEFIRTYGSLTNAGFVARVYENVLMRAPDANGLAYWTRRLDKRLLSRGQLMVQFSESREHQRRSDAVIEPLTAYFLLTGWVPTDQVLAPLGIGDDHYAVAADQIIGGEAWVRRYVREHL